MGALHTAVAGCFYSVLKIRYKTNILHDEDANARIKDAKTVSHALTEKVSKLQAVKP